MLMLTKTQAKPNTKVNYDALTKSVKQIAEGNEEEAYDFLEQAACIIMDEPVRRVVVDAIRTRKKWHQIKTEYKQMGKGSAAIQALAEKYYYSEKTIEAIVYNR